MECYNLLQKVGISSRGIHERGCFDVKSCRKMIHPNKSYFTSPEAHHSQLQFVHEDDLAAAFHTMVQHDLPGAYNVVGDEPDSMPHIAAAAGLNVIEIPHEMIVQSVTSSWKKGESVFGPEWAGGEGSLICSNEKLKATGYGSRAIRPLRRTRLLWRLWRS